MKRKYHTLLITTALLLTLACTLTPATLPTERPSRPCHSDTCRFQARRAVMQWQASPDVDGEKMWNGMEE